MFPWLSVMGERGVGQVQRPRLILLKGPRPGLKFVSRPKEQARGCSPRPKNSLDGFLIQTRLDIKKEQFYRKKVCGFGVNGSIFWPLTDSSR